MQSPFILLLCLLVCSCSRPLGPSPADPSRADATPHGSPQPASSSVAPSTPAFRESTPAAAPSGAVDPTGKQGVRGEVVRVTGDFMPPTPPGYEGRISPVVGRVFVFRGKLVPIKQPDEKHPALVTVVKTDAQGNYSVALVPGAYTVVAEIDGNLYLNGFDGAGNWSTIDVSAGKFTEWRIADTSRTTH